MSLGFSARIAVGSSSSWNTLAIGAGGFLRGIDIAPDGTIVANTDTFGAYIRNGSRWDQLVTSTRMPIGVQTPLNADGVYSIRIAPSNSSRLYMAYLNQIFRSDNKGASFLQPGTLGKTMSPNNGVAEYGPKMAVDPVNPDVCIVVTDNQGAWLTVDAGATWSKIAGVANNGTDGLCAVAFDSSGGVTGSPAKTRNVLIAVSGTGVYRSTTTASGTFALLASTPTNPSRIKVAASGIAYVTLIDGTKLWKLTGTTWADITPAASAGQIANVLIDPITANHITAFQASGYFIDSLDGGATWDPGGVNFQHSRVTSDIPYLGTLFQANTPPENDQAFNFSVGDLATDPTTGTTWMTGGQAIFTTGAIQRNNVNQVFTSNAVGIEQLVADQILIPPGNNPIIISWDTAVLVSADPTQYPTAERWDTTVEVNRGSAADYAKSNSSYIALIADQRASSSAYSTDGGLTWTKFTTVPSTGSGGSISVATSTNSVWAPGNNGDLFNTKDGGATWNKRTPSGVPASPAETGWGFDANLKKFIVTCDFVVNGGGFYTQYAYNYGPTGNPAVKGIWKSIDGGDTWTHAYTNWLSDIPSAGDNQWNSKLRSVPNSGVNQYPGVMFFTGGPQGGAGDAFPHNQSFWKIVDIGGVVTATKVNKANGFGSDILEVWDFHFGKAAPGSLFPTMFIIGWVDGVGGIHQSIDLGQTWVKIGSLYPTGWLDTLVAISGHPDIYGAVYVGFNGSGYGQTGGGAADLNYYAADTRFAFQNLVAQAIPTAGQEFWIHEMQSASPPYDATSPRFHYAGFTGSGSSGAEVDLPNDYDVDGVSVSVNGGAWQTVHGAVHVTSGVGVLSPGNAVVIQANSICRFRFAFHCAVGAKLPVGNILLSVNEFPGPPEIARSAGVSWTSQLLSATLSGSGNQAVGGSWWSPAYMVAKGRDGRPVIGLCGDSVAQGVEDASFRSSRMAYGFLKKGLDDNLSSKRMAVFDLALGGTHTLEFSSRSFWSRKLDAIKLIGNVPFTHVISELGAAGAANTTYAVMRPQQKTYIQLLASEWGKPIYANEWLPHTTASTDGVTTLANQNQATQERYPNGSIWLMNADFEANGLDGMFAGYIRAWEHCVADTGANHDKIKLNSFTTTLAANFVSGRTITLTDAPPIGVQLIMFNAGSPTVPRMGSSVLTVTGTGPYTVFMDGAFSGNPPGAIGDVIKASLSKDGVHMSNFMQNLILPTIIAWKNATFP